MMKRRGRALLLLIIVGGISAILLRDVNALLFKPEVEARAAFLMDAQTGKVYYESNADEALPPASMSKMMTEALVLKEVSSGKHKWNEAVKISSYAANAPGSKIGMKAKDTVSLGDLFQAMVVHSANDAAIALAEHLNGTESKFVARMNQEARNIGLSSKTVFANATGLPSRDLKGFKQAAAEGDTVMTARDTAKLASYLISVYPQVLDYSRLPDVKLSTKNVTLQTTNLMLPGKSYAFNGNDGLKTGFTDEAGYCFTGTANRDGRRLVSVVMGAAAPETRFTETEKLFSYGFSKF